MRRERKYLVQSERDRFVKAARSARRRARSECGNKRLSLPLERLRVLRQHLFQRPVVAAVG